MKPCFERVREGDFAAIPADFAFKGSAGLGHLIDGYAVAGSTSSCAATSHRVLADIERADNTNRTRWLLELRSQNLFAQNAARAFAPRHTRSVRRARFAKSSAKPLKSPQSQEHTVLAEEIRTDLT